MSDYHKVTKLKDQSNYRQWEVAVRNILVVKNIFWVVKSDYISPSNPNNPWEDQTESTKDAEEIWQKHADTDEETLAGIQITLTPDVYLQVEGIKTAKDCWAKLKQLYGTESYATKKATLFALYDIRADQFKDLHAYLSKFRKLTHKLAEMGDPMPIDHQAAIFERGLPRYLEHTAFTIMEIARTNKTAIDFNYITTSIVNHDKSCQAEESKAYAGKFGKEQQRKSSNKSRSSSPNLTCGHCGSNHSIKDCYHKNPHLAPEGFKCLTKEECDARNKRRRDQNKGWKI